MKVSSKPISSPSRTEKFPPPLMRFLRSNGGSRSRGRSRSSPMFVRKKNAVIETQEPSSPKVTCIGQVRVRRSSKNSGSRSNRAGRSRTPAKQRLCWWFRRTQFCNNRVKLKPISFRPVWRKWVLFFRFGYCKKVDTRDDSSKLESNTRGEYNPTGDIEDEDDEVDDKDGAEVRETKEVFPASSPPKNAFLLTRCRSAPYRSSSLANRFWGSPLVTLETGDGEDEEKKGLQRRQEEREPERPISESESTSRDSVENEHESEGNSRISKEFEGDSIYGRPREVNLQELRSTESGSARPPMLTRCKSEPARTGERLNPEGTDKVGFC